VTGNDYSEAHLNDMFPFRANEMAFMNSVVLGTSANRVIPKNFSSIPESCSTTSTTSTSNSSAQTSQYTYTKFTTENIDVPAMIAYRAVQASNTPALVVRLHSGAS